MRQGRERFQPGLLLATEKLDLGPAVGTADDGQHRDQEDGFQGMVLSLGPTGIVNLRDQGHQGHGNSGGDGHGRHSRQGNDHPSYP